MRGLTLRRDPPAGNEAEATLFGCGYGESVVLHVGQNHWIIVDSTLCRESKEPVALIYLRNLGVNVSERVIGVVVTHWHDDHIQGISKIAKECAKAKFFLSAALMCAKDTEKFKKLALDSAAARLAALNANSRSGISEFGTLLKTLEENNNRPIYALCDRLLMEAEAFKLYALSPHDDVFRYAIDAIISQIPDRNGAVCRLSSPSPNDVSIVLWLHIGNERLLLGADLEENSRYKGWSLIVEKRKPSIIDAKASFLKVAHHGSQNGHHDGVWEHLLLPSPICFVAPYNKGKKPLPSLADAERISRLSSNAYITAIPSLKNKAPTSKEKHVQEKYLEKKVESLRPLYSYVSARKQISEKDWRITTYGNAGELQVIEASIKRDNKSVTSLPKPR